MHCGQVIQSHALSFFHLSAPDLLLGFDSDPARRNIIGLIEDHPEIARDGIASAQVRPAGDRGAGRGTDPSVVDRARRRQRAAGRPRRGIASWRRCRRRRRSRCAHWACSRASSTSSPKRSRCSAMPDHVRGTGRRRRQAAAVRRAPAVHRRGRRKWSSIGWRPQDYRKYIGEATVPHSS